MIYVETPYFQHLNIPGGHDKRRSQGDVFFMRNQTIFALRSGGMAALVMIAGFGAYLLVKGFRISTIVKGVAQGVATKIKG